MLPESLRERMISKAAARRRGPCLAGRERRGALASAGRARPAAWLLGLAGLVGLVGAPAALADETRPGLGGQPTLPSVAFTIEGHALHVELAVEPEQRYLGLSNRTRLAEGAGMLFVYPEERALTFTMRDTLLPLSIAYIDDSLVILEILDMNVGPGQLFPSRQPARYALEVNQGWFERRDIEPGARLTLVDGALR